MGAAARGAGTEALRCRRRGRRGGARVAARLEEAERRRWIGHGRTAAVERAQADGVGLGVGRGGFGEGGKEARGRGEQVEWGEG